MRANHPIKQKQNYGTAREEVRGRVNDPAPVVASRSERQIKTRQ